MDGNILLPYVIPRIAFALDMALYGLNNSKAKQKLPQKFSTQNPKKINPSIYINEVGYMLLYDTNKQSRRKNLNDYNKKQCQSQRQFCMPKQKLTMLKY